MGRKFRRVLTWFAGILVGLVVLLWAGLYIYTRTPQFRALLREKIVAAADDALNGRLEFKEITGSVWRDLEFHDFAIVQDGERVFYAPVVSINVGLLGQVINFLRASAIRIGEVEIVEPELKLVQARDKSWNLAKLVKKSDEPESPRTITIALHNIQIKNGKLQALTADGKAARATALNGVVDVDLPLDGAEIHLNKLAFALSAVGMPDSNWSAALALKQSEKSSSLALTQANIATAHSRVSLRGTIDNLTAPTSNLTLDLTRLAANDVRTIAPAVPLKEDIAGRIRASGSLSKLQLAAELAAPSGRVTASTVADLQAEKPQFQGRLDLQEFVVDRVLALPGVKGTANAQAAFKGGSLDDAEATFQGRIAGLAYQDWTLGQTALSGQLQKRRAALTARSEEKNGEAEIKATVALTGTPAYEATLRARGFDVKKLAAKRELPAAKINLDATVKGRGTQPESMQAETRFTFAGSQINGVRLDQARAEASVQNGTLTLKELRLAADGTTLNANGSIASVAKNATGRITYTLNSRDINRWARLAGIDADGRLSADGAIGGSLEAPQLDGKASFNRLQVASHRAQSGTLRWSVASRSNSWQGKIDLAAQQVNAGIALAAVEAHVDLGGTRPLALAADITARDVDKRVQRVTGRASQSGERTEITLQQISLQLPDGPWRNPGPAHLTLVGKRITVDELILQRDAQTLNVKGVVGTEGPQDLSLRVNGFSLADLRPYWKNAPEIAGRLTLALQVRGTAIQPLIDSNVSIDRLSIAGQSYAGLTAQSSYQKERLAVDLRLLQDAAHSLNVNGTLPVYIGWGGKRSVAVTGDSNLRIHSDGLSPTFLTAFTRDVDNLQGSLSMDVVVRGPLQALAPNGTLRFQNGGARIRRAGVTLSAIDLQAAVSPSAIQITRLAARSGGGELTGTGRLAIKGSAITAIGANLKAQDFQLINTREYKANASGNLTASGTLQEPVVRGDLTAGGTLRPNLSAFKTTGKAAQDPTIVVVRDETELAAPAKSSVQKSNAQDAGAEEQEESPLFQRLRLDLTTKISRGTWVYLDEGTIEVTGQLRIRKEPKDKMTIAGTLEGVRGWYTFQGRRFEIEKAQLIFTGGSQVDPALDIVASHKAGQYQVEIVIGGYASKPTLALRSTPSLEQADILAVLLFGKPTRDLNQGEKNALQTQALQTAANFISSDLRQSVASKLGVDTLELGVGDNATGQISAGKYVTQDVFVSTKQQLGGERQQEYSIEYDIAPNWQLKSSTSPTGNSGFDILWRKQY